MWPWEHLAVGYVLVSLLWRARGRRPDGSTALAVAVGTQLPDLVDKSLAWELSVLQRGISLAHSALIAIPVCLLIVLLARRYGRALIAEGFALGYLSHLPADAIYPAFYGDGLRIAPFLWPLFTPPSDPPGGLAEKIPEYLAQSLALVTGPRGAVFVLLELLVLGTALALWVSDGMPGLPRVRRFRPRPGDR